MPRPAAPLRDDGLPVPTAQCSRCGSTLREGHFSGLCPRCVAAALFDEGGASEFDLPAATPESTGGVPRRLGDYELEREIGHGGMGVVYRARQLSLQRTVAIKLLLHGPFATPEGVQRFLREAEATARLRHPNIVGVHGVGADAGFHYFSMDYVEGQTLAEVLRAGPIPPPRAAALVRTLASAVEYAHGRGFIHRDLKPSNILIDAAGQPHIIDFGLAKWMDGPLDQTRTGQVLGSPAYLAPEQAAGRQQEIGPATDVYSLGALLYECLTGRAPFIGSNVTDVLRQVAESMPIQPRHFLRTLPADLEAVAMRCLEKSPSRRYPRAGALEADLDRYLNGAPTQARPAGPVGRVFRWARRRPLSALALVLICTTALVSTLAARSAVRARRQAQRVNEQLADSVHRLKSQAAENAVVEGHVADGLSVLAQLLRERPTDTVLATRLCWLLSRSAFARPLGTPLIHESPLTALRFDDQSAFIATASSDGSARLWRASDSSLIRLFPGKTPLANVLPGPAGATVLVVPVTGGGRLYRAADGQMLREWAAEPNTPARAVARRDRSLAALATGPSRLQLLDLGTGQERGAALRLGSLVTACEWDAPGQHLVTGTAAGELRLWRLTPSGIELRQQTDLGDPITAIGITPDANRVLAGTRHGILAIFDAADFRHSLTNRKRTAGFQFIRCAPANSPRRALISAFGDWTEIWDLDAMRMEGLFRRPDTEIALQGAWSPDGTRVVLGFRSGMVEIYDAATLKPVMESFEHLGTVVGVAFSADGTRVLTGAQDGTARLWDVQGVPSSPQLARVPGRPGPELIAEAGRLWLSAFEGREVSVCDVSGSTSIHASFQHDAEVTTAALSPSARQLAVGARGVWLYDLQSPSNRLGPLGPREPIEAIAWSPRGRWLIAGTSSGKLQRWETTTGRALTDEFRVPPFSLKITVSPQERNIAVICADATVRVLETETLREQFPPLQHRGRIWTAEFSPDGNRLVTAAVDRQVRVWDLRSGALLGQPMLHERPALVARFSPDGKLIASGGEDNRVRLWNAATGQLHCPPLEHRSRVWILAFSADGQQLLTAADLGEARIWDVRSGLPLTGIMAQEGTLLRAWFRPGGLGVMTATHHGHLVSWDNELAPAPVPTWLPDLAEVLAGHRVRGDGAVVSVGPEALGALRVQLPTLPRGNFYRDLVDRMGNADAVPPSPGPLKP